MVRRAVAGAPSSTSTRPAWPGLPEIERNLYQAIRSMRGDTSMESFTTYDFQKGSALDPTSILKIQTPWQANGPVNKSPMRPPL